MKRLPSFDHVAVEAMRKYAEVLGCEYLEDLPECVEVHWVPHPDEVRIILVLDQPPAPAGEPKFYPFKLAADPVSMQEPIPVPHTVAMVAVQDWRQERADILGMAWTVPIEEAT